MYLLIAFGNISNVLSSVGYQIVNISSGLAKGVTDGETNIYHEYVGTCLLQIDSAISLGATAVETGGVTASAKGGVKVGNESTTGTEIPVTTPITAVDGVDADAMAEN